MTKPTFGQQYYGLLAKVEREGIHQLNERTGEGCRSLFGESMHFSINKLPLIPQRRTYPHIMLAEAAWMCMGTKEPWISKHAGIWDKFIEHEGPDEGLIKNAYGHRFRSHFGRDQLQCVVDSLASDRTSRQAVLMAWDPAVDGLGAKNGKNVPCPLGATFNILNDRLNCHVVHRSCDLICGFPYDVGMYTFLTHIIAHTMGNVLVGDMCVSMAHAHVYDVHSEIMQQMRQSEYKEIHIGIPCYTIDEMANEAIADAEVYLMKEHIQHGRLHPFISDKAEVVL